MNKVALAANLISIFILNGLRKSDLPNLDKGFEDFFLSDEYAVLEVGLRMMLV